MVKIVFAACVVLMLAVPVLAQEDYPRIQTTMGYANLGFIDFGTGDNSRHHGFVNQTGFNLTKVYGVENYMGIYGLGQGTTLIADFVGGKATYRAAKVAPYVLAGIGLGYFTQSSAFGTLSYGTKFATRFGAGVDVPFSDTMALKFEVSRMGFKFDQLTPGKSWTSGTNFAAGIVFTLAQ